MSNQVNQERKQQEDEEIIQEQQVEQEQEQQPPSYEPFMFELPPETVIRQVMVRQI
jgi:hypothetical protein